MPQTILSLRPAALFATLVTILSWTPHALADTGAARAAYEKGRAALAAGDDHAARGAFEEAAAHVPAWVHPRLELAELAVKRGERMAEERQALSALAAGNPGLLRMHRLLGELSSLVGDDEAAVASFDRAIELSPWESGPFYEKKALALSRLGSHAEAAEAFREALRRNPDELHLRARLADSLEAAGRKDEARAELLALVRLQPDRESPLRRLARFYERDGSAAEARATHARADRLRAAPTRPARNLRPLLPSKR